MTAFWIFLAVVVVTLFLFSRRVSTVTPKDCQELLKSGAVVVDVRSPQEFQTDHLPMARNIPLDDLGEVLPRQIPDRNQVILLHCQSGLRSRNALNQLQRMGYHQARNLGSLAQARRMLLPG